MKRKAILLSFLLLVVWGCGKSYVTRPEVPPPPPPCECEDECDD